MVTLDGPSKIPEHVKQPRLQQATTTKVPTTDVIRATKGSKPKPIERRKYTTEEHIRNAALNKVITPSFFDSLYLYVNQFKGRWLYPASCRTMEGPYLWHRSVRDGLWSPYQTGRWPSFPYVATTIWVSVSIIYRRWTPETPFQGGYCNQFPWTGWVYITNICSS